MHASGTRVPCPQHDLPYLPSANHLLGRIDGLAAPRAALGAPDLLGELGRVGVGGGPVARGPAQGKACGEGTYREQHSGGDRPGGRQPPAPGPARRTAIAARAAESALLTGDAPRARGSPPLMGDPPGPEGHLRPRGTHQGPVVFLPRDVRLLSAPVRTPESPTAHLLRTGPLCPPAAHLLLETPQEKSADRSLPWGDNLGRSVESHHHLRPSPRAKGLAG